MFLGDDQKRKRKQKIMENKLKRLGGENNPQILPSGLDLASPPQHHAPNPASYMPPPHLNEHLQRLPYVGRAGEHYPPMPHPLAHPPISHSRSLDQNVAFNSDVTLQRPQAAAAITNDVRFNAHLWYAPSGHLQQGHAFQSHQQQQHSQQQLSSHDQQLLSPDQQLPAVAPSIQLHSERMYNDLPNPSQPPPHLSHEAPTHLVATALSLSPGSVSMTSFDDVSSPETLVTSQCTPTATFEALKEETPEFPPKIEELSQAKVTNMTSAATANRTAAKRSFCGRRSPRNVEAESQVPLAVDAGCPPPSAASSDISGGRLLQTTLKVIQDAKVLQANLSTLPPPVTKPIFAAIFSEAIFEHAQDSPFTDVAAHLREACLSAYDNLPENDIPSDPSYVQMFNFGEDTIRQLVTLAKHLPPFQALCRDDQISLLKGSVLYMMVIKSAMSFDPQLRGWRVRDAQGERDVIPNSVRANQDGRVLMNHYYIIVMKLLVSSNRDLVIIVLLIILALLSRENVKDDGELVNPQKVDTAHALYAEFLRSYVTRKFGERPEMFRDLLLSLDIVRDFSDTYINAMLKSPVSQINPLLKEINDIMSN